MTVDIPGKDRLILPDDEEGLSQTDVFKLRDWYVEEMEYLPSSLTIVGVHKHV